MHFRLRRNHLSVGPLLATFSTQSADLRGGRDISNTLTLQNLRKFSGSMIKQSIRRRIVAIAVGLIILMVATSVLLMVMVGRVGHLLDELTTRYIPANAHLTRINILSLERTLALRRMVIAKMQEPPDELGYKLRKQIYDAKDAEVDSEAQAARKLINAITEDTSTPSDNAALARIDSRIDSLMNESRLHPRVICSPSGASGRGSSRSCSGTATGSVCSPSGSIKAGSYGRGWWGMKAASPCLPRSAPERIWRPALAG
jgi:hypothetical protein